MILLLSRGMMPAIDNLSGIGAIIVGALFLLLACVLIYWSERKP